MPFSISLSKKKFTKRFETKKVIGEGSFSCVLLCKDNDSGEDVAVKKIKFDKKQFGEVLNEAILLDRAAHRYVVRLVDWVKQQGYFYIAQELCPGGDLQQAISRQRGNSTSFHSDLVAKWCVQILLGIQHCHSKNILHRDLKPGNVFLDAEHNCKIGDFGVAKDLSTTKCCSSPVVYGTPHYMSPEQVLTKPFSFPSDMWSIGVILYELCALHNPFVKVGDSNLSKVELEQALKQRISSAEYPELPSNTVLLVLRDTIGRLLIPLASERPSAEDICSREWFMELSKRGDCLEEPAKKKWMEYISIEHGVEKLASIEEQPSCHGCATSVQPSWEFCPVCQIKLSQSPKTCEQCHTTIENALQTCLNCLPRTIMCLKCEGVLSSGWQFCPHCLAEVAAACVASIVSNDATSSSKTIPPSSGASIASIKGTGARLIAQTHFARSSSMRGRRRSIASYRSLSPCRSSRSRSRSPSCETEAGAQKYASVGEADLLPRTHQRSPRSSLQAHVR